MLIRLLTWMLRMAGKDYRPAEGLPSGLILSVFTMRGVWLLRGFLRLRASCFVGPGVVLRGRGFIHAGRYSTFETACRIDGYSQQGVRIGPRTKIGSYAIIACTGHLSKL